MFVLSSYKTKKECFQAIRNHIYNAVSFEIEHSQMYWSENNSKNTQSKYINLCFNSKDENPFEGKLPFVVRLSDHKSNTLFKKSQPNHEVFIYPVFEEKDKIELDYSIECHKVISKQILVSNSKESKNKLKTELILLERKIEEINRRATYMYDGSLEQIIIDLKQILLANKKQNKAA